MGREGHYEKELFAGSGSNGRSKRVKTTVYRVKGAVGYAFSPRHFVDLSVAATADPAEYRNLWLQPLYNNRIIDNPKPEQRLAAELNYSFQGEIWSLKSTLFAT